ncbi:hypothetical protein [Aestuariivirga sp.]|uniref:hypothetical protein n=1 Tax=Aestuariivirga sp. TaxID=2650926 RepID=UPI0039E5D7D2
MKYTWERDDIIVGRLVDTSNRTERSIIGYDLIRDAADGNLALVSLRDGLVIIRDLTAEALAEHLNKHGALPVHLLDPNMLQPTKITN